MKRILAAVPAAVLLAGLVGASAAGGEVDRQARESAAQRSAETALDCMAADDWGRGIAEADRAWEAWRDAYAGAPRPQQTQSGMVRPPYDPDKAYERAPSQAALRKAEAILDLLHAGADPKKMIGPLLEVRTPELAGHAYGIVMRMGVRMCEDGNAAEGIPAVFAGYRAMGNYRPELDSHERVVPRMSRMDLDGQAFRNFYEGALTGNSFRQLYEGYRALPPDTLRTQVALTVIGMSGRHPFRPEGLRPTALAEAALDDPDPAVRKYTADYIGSGGPPTWAQAAGPAAMIALLRRHRDDPDEDVRLAVLTALVARGDEAALKSLTAFTSKLPVNGPPLLRIGQMGAVQAIPWMLEVARRHAWCRDGCIRSLFLLADPAGVEFLGGILVDRNEKMDLRVVAAGALGETMDDKALPFLVRALEGADERLTRNIVEALPQIRPALSFPILWRLAQKQPQGQAWLLLQQCARVRDGCLVADADLMAGMQEYWDGRRKLWQGAKSIQHYRHVAPDPAREAAARDALARLRRSVPARCLVDWRGPSVPDPLPQAP